MCTYIYIHVYILYIIIITIIITHYYIYIYVLPFLPLKKYTGNIMCLKCSKSRDA